MLLLRFLKIVSLFGIHILQTVQGAHIICTVNLFFLSCSKEANLATFDPQRHDLKSAHPVLQNLNILPSSISQSPWSAPWSSDWSHRNTWCFIYKISTEHLSHLLHCLQGFQDPVQPENNLYKYIFQSYNSKYINHPFVFFCSSNSSLQWGWSLFQLS